MTNSAKEARGRFITIEGIEGVGKTTNLNAICEYLKLKYGLSVLSTREPGGTWYAEKIRDLLLLNGPEPLAQETELLLMFASRAQHVHQKIKPALQAGQWVVCSRFTDSSIAYQGGGRGVSVDKIRAVASVAMDAFEPDLTILLDLPAEVGLARAKARAELDRIEQEEITFFERVRQQYLSLAQQYPQRIKVVSADQPLEHVQADIQRVVDNFI